MVAVSYIGWGLPLLLIPVSFLTYRMKNKKKKRYLVYIFILFVAFIFNLTGISFKVDFLDSTLYLVVSFIICEFCWSITRIKNRPLVTLFVICGVILFGAAYKDWLVGGPQKNNSLRATTIKDRYIIRENVYTVKERNTFTAKGMTKTIALYRDITKHPFETRIGEYVLPEGYFKAQIRYHWTRTPRGVKLNLIGDSDTLWSLGDGL
ncbi:MAG: hypothetical protein GX640_15140 [Fibrobacter sp.]|nr:hypothetical protein [Fibrobacter sp.]